MSLCENRVWGEEKELLTLMWRWTKHSQIPGMGMGAAGSVLMADQAVLRPSPVLRTLLKVALSSFLSCFGVARGTGGVSAGSGGSGQRG